MEILIAILGVGSAVITISLTNYFTKKNQLKFDERKLKEMHYINFMNVMSEMLTSNFSDKTRRDFAHIQNNLFLIASSDVVVCLMDLNQYLSSGSDSFSQTTHNEKLTELIKAMRIDLFDAEKVNENYPIIELRTINKK